MDKTERLNVLLEIDILLKRTPTHNLTCQCESCKRLRELGTKLDSSEEGQLKQWERRFKDIQKTGKLELYDVLELLESGCSKTTIMKGMRLKYNQYFDWLKLNGLGGKIDKGMKISQYTHLLKNSPEPLDLNLATIGNSRNSKCKLTDEQVRYIRDSAKSVVALSKELGVDRRTVGNVRKGRSYKWVK